MNVTVLLILIILCTSSLLAQDWQYLGQTTPGMDPVRFPPDSLLGNSDWFWHDSPVFSPDGEELFMSRYYIDSTVNPLMYSMEVVNEEWSTPVIPNFCEGYSANSPAFTISGDSLFFISKRPEPSVFFTTNNNNVWTAPVEVNIPKPAQAEFGNSISVARNKTLYFELSISGDNDLYKSEFANGQYTEPINLGTTINSNETEFGVYIDPDEQYIMFSSLRNGGYGASDLYISSKDFYNNWTEAQNMGNVINSNNDDFGPWISNDEFYFFFCTQRSNDLGYNPYWVDAQIIFDMITDVEPQQIIPKSEYTLYNYPNPFNPATTISFSLTTEVKENTELEIYNIKGQLIRSIPIISSTRQPFNSVTWNGKDNNSNQVSSGIYYYKLNTSNSPVKKMVLLK